MSGPKTKPTKVRAEGHIAAIANEEHRNDENGAERIAAVGGRCDHEPPRLNKVAMHV